LSVSGRRLVDSGGKTIRLVGVNRPGTHYECVQTTNRIFDGPSDDASVQAIADWQATAVRVPLNEDCWLGINGVAPAVSGQAYRDAIADYVTRLNNHGLVAILDLQWSDGYYTGGSCQLQANPGSAVCLKPMPDASHAPSFWSSVASTFRLNHAVVFDVFSEPFPDRVMSFQGSAWACWLRGGQSCTGFSYAVAGMQALVSAIRRTGASNVVMVGGINYANDDSGWLIYRPVDPDHALAVSWHSYNFDACNNRACWDRQVAPVAGVVPIIAGEIGEDDCAHSYIDGLMTWLDSRGGSYLGWAWKAEDARYPCGDHNGGKAGPALITSYDGTPTGYGIGLETHLDGLDLRGLGAAAHA
jgi:endoglucanase